MVGGQREAASLVLNPVEIGSAELAGQEIVVTVAVIIVEAQLAHSLSEVRCNLFTKHFQSFQALVQPVPSWVGDLLGEAVRSDDRLARL
jgi:hypothetical protein